MMSNSVLAVLLLFVLISSGSSDTTVPKTLKRVFVYGTLKRGEPNNYWLTSEENGKAQFLTNGKTVQKFPLVIATESNIPFLLNKPGTGYQIEGEIYDVDNTMFDNLDELEDYPDLYDREKQAIITEHNETMECWLYLKHNVSEDMLNKTFLSSYHNTPDQPYLFG